MHEVQYPFQLCYKVVKGRGREETEGGKEKVQPGTQIGFILSDDCEPALEITDATWFTIILLHL